MYDLLTIAAEVAVALAGFSGLFVAFSGRARSMASIERYALLYLLFSSLGAVVLALLPYVLMAITQEDTFSDWFCIFSAVVLLSITSWTTGSSLRRKSMQKRRRYKWIRPILMPLQWIVSLLQLMPLVSDVNPYAVYALALWWLIFSASVQFIIQVASAIRPDQQSQKN